MKVKLLTEIWRGEYGSYREHGNNLHLFLAIRSSTPFSPQFQVITETGHPKRSNNCPVVAIRFF